MPASRAAGEDYLEPDRQYRNCLCGKGKMYIVLMNAEDTGVVSRVMTTAIFPNVFPFFLVQKGADAEVYRQLRD